MIIFMKIRGKSFVINECEKYTKDEIILIGMKKFFDYHLIDIENVIDRYNFIKKSNFRIGTRSHQFTYFQNKDKFEKYQDNWTISHSFLIGGELEFTEDQKRILRNKLKELF